MKFASALALLVVLAASINSSARAQTQFCFGTSVADPGCGPENACRCGNGGDGLGGCADGIAGGTLGDGGILSFSGTADLQSDTLNLDVDVRHASGGFAMLIRSNVAAPCPIVLADGLRCLNSPLQRILPLHSLFPGGTTTFPMGTEPLLSDWEALFNPGNLTMHYQVYFRTRNACLDSGAIGSVNTYNLTNALEVDWTP